MIVINRDFVKIDFKKGPFAKDAQGCIRLAMEMLNLSKAFKAISAKDKKPPKKFEKTGRVRRGIQRFVNKNGVNPLVVDRLIGTIRQGNLNIIKVPIGENIEIELSPNNDVPGVIADLMVKRII
jgi:hypothetical protein